MVHGYNAQSFKPGAMIIVLSLCRLLPFLVLFLLQACQYGNAINTANLTQKNKQNSAAAYNTQLGLAYLKQGDRPRAKRKLINALTLAPNSAEANVAMAYYLEKTDDIEEAEEYYRKALAITPKNGAQLNNYGAFLCRRGKYQEADNYFIKAIKDPQYLHRAGAYENAGLCAAAIPNYYKAKRYFIKALKQDPQRKQALYELASIELKQKEAQKALMYLQQYPALSLNDIALLKLAEEAARQAGKRVIANDYEQRLRKLNNFTDSTGAKNEYNNNG